MPYQVHLLANVDLLQGKGFFKGLGFRDDDRSKDAAVLEGCSVSQAPRSITTWF